MRAHLKQRHQQKLESELKIRATSEKVDSLSKIAVGRSNNYDEATGKEKLSFSGYTNLEESSSYDLSKPLPPSNILSTDQTIFSDKRVINQTTSLIEKTLAEFGIVTTVIGFRAGPSIIQFAVQPSINYKKRARYTKEEEAQQIRKYMTEIASLQKDLALALSTDKIRIEAPVPGKPYVGIELPNTHRSTIGMRSILETKEFHKVDTSFGLALGRDIYNKPVVADLTRMPHLLIAGGRNSGKSTCLSSIAACLAMNNLPRDMRMVMIASRMGQLPKFDNLPHLYGPVVTDIAQSYNVFHWLNAEMERRYKLFDAAHIADLSSLNRRIAYQKEGRIIPRLVVFLDELADLIMYGPKQAENDVIRLIKMGSAIGIHLILATLHLSPDVLTRSIKSNILARIAFAVSSEAESRIILDMNGAESLLGQGDMLFLNTGANYPVRAQGVMTTPKDIENIINYWRKDTNIDVDIPLWETQRVGLDGNEDEILVQKAIDVVKQNQRVSASLLQRRLRVGFPRASRLLDQLEARGVVGPSKGGGKERDVLMKPVVNVDQDKNYVE